jgi:hypothetical protein
LGSGAIQPVSQLIYILDVVLRLELPNEMLPDHGRGNGVRTAAALRRYRVPKITSHSPQPSARQSGQQAFGDFVGADDSQRKCARRMLQRVKVFQKRGFEAGIMNNDGALFYLIGNGGSICGLDEFVPDVGGRKCLR